MYNPFWEKSYQQLDITTFGLKPNKTIKQMWKKFPKNGNILEVGCGEGKNSLFLAKQGFIVDAFDISENGIKKAKYLATKKILN